MQNQSQTSRPKATQHYATRLGSYDEMLSEANKILPHWQHFIHALENMGTQEMETRHREAQRLLHENGVTYTVYNDATSTTRPWQLDPIPLLLSASEWQNIEAGLQQRAHILNLLLHDLYGKQQTIKNGILPAELIFAHRDFLLPCMDSLPEKQQLIVYAANLARGTNGNIWVLNDHTQAPSGIGYSLENRSVIGQVMHDLFTDAKVMRTTHFFNALQEALIQSAPHNQDDPHIAVLTPGPLNETYFEHAYLASQLGFSLAQGDDLTMRDNKIWLRTLEGLQPVDVILRRIDDSYSDPLELRADSQLGVAGLLQAARHKQVSIANPLGSSILENSGILAFLPNLCRYFLNENLRLPSIATWWCGQPKERDFVISNLDKMVIKSINRSFQTPSMFGDQLNNQQRDQLIRAIKARPYTFIGQERVTFSTAPTLINGKIKARNAVIRCFAVYNDDAYTFMPGGLTRVSLDKDQFNVSNQSGAVSKDTWVLADNDEVLRTPPVFLKTNDQQITAISEPLSSRAADNLFWVGRHYERIISSTRLFRTILFKQANLMSGYEHDNSECLLILLRSLTHLTVSYPGFIGKSMEHSNEHYQEMMSLFKDQQRHGTLANNIHAFFQTAFNIRDLWSQDTWRCIDGIHTYWQTQVINTPQQPHPAHHLPELSTRLAAFSGLTAESMTRESGWLLLQLGRRLENALSIIALLRSSVVQQRSETLQNQILEAVLLATDSSGIYQRRYRSVTRLPLVLELLLLDQTHPHSLLFQLQKLQHYIELLPGQTIKNHLRKEQYLILKANSELQLCHLDQLIELKAEQGVYAALETLLANTSNLLWEMSEAIAHNYFNHITETHQLSPTSREPTL